jgi:hypothetical protein
MVVFLGAIAAATVAMALIQIGAIIYAGRLARRVERLVDRIEGDLQPVFDAVTSIARDASRASAMAVAQVERADDLLGDLAQRLAQLLTTLQTTLMGPAREGRAIMSGLRAALEALRLARGDFRTRSRSEDEDPLFI